MLVITRRVEEGIQIGPDIRIVLTKAQNGRAQIGVTAPAELKIHRVPAPAAALGGRSESPSPNDKP